MVEPAVSRTPSPDSPEALLEKFLAGDDAAFTRLVARYESRLYAYIARMAGDAVPPADIFQKTFITAAETASSFDWRTSSFSTWLYRIARNAALEEIRLRSPSSSPGGAGEAADSADGRRIRAALVRLPADQREAFLLKEEGDLTFEEIGSVLGCGREAARSRFHSAAGALRSPAGTGAHD